MIFSSSRRFLRTSSVSASERSVRMLPFVKFVEALSGPMTGEFRIGLESERTNMPSVTISRRVFFRATRSFLTDTRRFPPTASPA